MRFPVSAQTAKTALGLDVPFQIAEDHYRMPNRFYGWRRGLPSRRFPQLALTAYPALPASVDLTTLGYLPPIWDQGQTSSCTGHGVTRGIMYARAKAGKPFVDLSRLFPYYNARFAEGQADQDSGAVIGDVVDAALKYGDCPYSDLPTDPALVVQHPTEAAFDDAVPNKSQTATRVLGSTGASLEYHLRHCLAVLGVPVIIGISVYESFESEEVAKTGIVPMPAADEVMVGGHCVTVVGYDDASKLLKCENSWGTDWGQAGRFQIPYAYVFDPGLADDFHAITL